MNRTEIIARIGPKKAQDYFDIIAGKKLPQLTSDVIGKKIFDPDEHPDRLTYILRQLSGDETIKVDRSAKNEGYVTFTSAKKIITDIPSHLRDGRIADLEIQVVSQNFIFRRSEIYASNMILLQYSAGPGQKKGDVDYSKTQPALLVIMMRNSPRIFKRYKTDHYIHRFTSQTADSGLTFPSLCPTIYVELDKCLQQLHNGMDGEHDRKLQYRLAAIADINDAEATKYTKDDAFLNEIRLEVDAMSQDKEVQRMLFEEQLAISDWVSWRNEAIREGQEEGRQKGLQEGRQKGLQEGRQEGKNSIIYSLVHDGDLSEETGARKLDITVEELHKRMALAGFE